MAKVRGRGKVGDVVKIDLGNGSFGYGRVLPDPLMAFYHLHSAKPMAAAEVIKSPILFLVSVMRRAIKSDHWEIIGNYPSDALLETKPRFFMQDMLSKEFSIYYEGKMTPASREECVGLERAAVWEAVHVENRLRNYFSGMPDPMTDRLKLPEA